MYLDYLNFYDIAEYGNEHWKGNFSSREIADNAYNYKTDYDHAIADDNPNATMIDLCRLICEDRNIPTQKDLTLDQMQTILNDFVLEVL